MEFEDAYALDRLWDVRTALRLGRADAIHDALKRATTTSGSVDADAFAALLLEILTSEVSA